MLGVGGVGVFGDGAPGHFRGEGGFVVRAVLVQPPARLRHQAVDGRAGDDVRERRVLKLTDGKTTRTGITPMSPISCCNYATELKISQLC